MVARLPGGMDACVRSTGSIGFPHLELKPTYYDRWTHNNSGTLVLMANSTASTGSTSATFPNAFPAVPKFAYGMHIVKTSVDDKGNLMQFDLRVATLTGSGFTINHTIGTKISFPSLSISYISIDPSDNTLFTYYDVLGESTGFANCTPMLM